LELQTNELQHLFPEEGVFETIAVLSMILFASIGAGLFVMNRQAMQDEAQSKRHDSPTR
jgi:hypothetical protein